MPPNTQIPPIPVAPLAPEPAPIYPPPQPHNSSGIAVGIVIGLMIAVVAGGAYFLYARGGLSIGNVDNQTTDSSQVAPSQNNIVTGSTTCDNFQCLIQAASTCSPISATVNYTNMPVPLMQGLVAAGTTKYVLAKGSTADKCNLTYTSLSATLSLSADGRKEAIAEGAKDADITAQLKNFNDSLLQQGMTTTVCNSDMPTLAAFFTDKAKNLPEESESSVHADQTGSVSTSVTTTSTGQKLTCVLQNK